MLEGARCREEGPGSSAALLWAPSLPPAVSPPPRRHHRHPTSCVQCREAKQRCDWARQPSCLRCYSLGLPCTPGPQARATTSLGISSPTQVKWTVARPIGGPDVLAMLHEGQCATLAALKQSGEVDWERASFISRSTDFYFGVLGCYATRPRSIKALRAAVVEAEMMGISMASSPSTAAAADWLANAKKKRCRKELESRARADELFNTPGAATIRFTGRPPGGAINVQVKCNALMREMFISELDVLEWSRQRGDIGPFALTSILDSESSADFGSIVHGIICAGSEGDGGICMLQLINRHGRRSLSKVDVHFHFSSRDQELIETIRFWPIHTVDRGGPSASLPGVIVDTSAGRSIARGQQQQRPPRVMRTMEGAEAVIMGYSGSPVQHQQQTAALMPAPTQLAPSSFAAVVSTPPSSSSSSPSPPPPPGWTGSSQDSGQASSLRWQGLPLPTAGGVVGNVVRIGGADYVDEYGAAEKDNTLLELDDDEIRLLIDSLQ